MFSVISNDGARAACVRSLFVAFAIFLCLCNARAATFTVSNSNDSGLGSLRQAIVEANILPDHDEIVFDGFFDAPRTITLLGGNLEITSGLTINGKGSNLLTVSGNDLSRIFELKTANTPVTISGMTITGGRASQGGGIKNSINLTLNNVVVAGNNAPSNPAQGGGIWNSGTLTMNGSTVSSNVANNGCPNWQGCNQFMNYGGGIYNAATATLNKSVVSYNLTTSRGGGIMTDDAGHTIINDSTVSNNTVTVDGGFSTEGGGLFGYGRMTITRSTVNGNTPNGIAIEADTDEPATITNSTIAGNYGDVNGAGISVKACVNYSLALCGVLDLIGSTVTDNHSQRGGGGEDGGGGIYCVSPYCKLNNSIVAGNIHDGGNRVDVYAAYRDWTPEQTDARFSGSYNLIGRGDNECGNPNGTCGLDNGANHNQVGSNNSPLDPRFSGGLQFNGGPTQTIGLRPDSSAIDQGNAIGTDQRGGQRPFDYESIPNAGNGADIGAVESGTFIVNSLVDTPDNAAGDGVCGDGANCALRAAIEEANAAGAGTISFDLPGSGMRTIELTSALPTLSAKITIAGPGADKLTIRRNSTAPFGIIKTANTITISGITITNGQAESRAGGIHNMPTGNLTLDGVVITANRAYALENSSSWGGGIYNEAFTTLTVKNSTISNNIADGGNGGNGGGMVNFSSTGVTLINSTVSGNIAESGAGVFNASNCSMSITNSTVAFNAADVGGGILHETGTGTLSLKNTIIANNAGASGAPDVYGAITSNGFNLVQSRAWNFGLNSTTDLPNGTEARLNPVIALNGGTTPTHALRPGSAAIDKGTAAVTTDQRGINRIDLSQIPNNPAGGGNGSDIGAFEMPVSWNTLRVTKTADTNDGACISADCSLREAVAAANATTLPEVITFSIPANDPGCDGTTGMCTIELTMGSEIVIGASGGELSIDGGRADALTVNAGNGFQHPRIFYTDGARVVLENMTLVNGSGSGANANGYGGAVYANGGSLVLTGVEVKDNFASQNGGGVYFNGGADHQIRNSTISNNITMRNCGGFDNDGGTLSVVNSTVTGNSSSYLGGVGGGFCNSGNATLRNVTVTSNITTSGAGGIYNFNGTLDLGNTIVAGNRGGSSPEISSGTVTTAGYNLIGSNGGVASQFPAGNPNANNDRVGTSAAPLNPRLAPLGNYGGPTETHAVLSSSAAVNHGGTANVVALVTDQRGAFRGDQTDIGAFESSPAYIAVLRRGDRGRFFSQTITPFNEQNNVEFTYAVTSGSLPPGLTLSSDPAAREPAGKRDRAERTLEAPMAGAVTLTGTPTLAGTYQFTISATGGGDSVATNYSITVFAPTAASVTVGGRVLTADGRGIRNVRVSMTDAQGNTRTAITGSFGYYQFSDVAVGETYVFGVAAKRYSFDPPVQIRSIQDGRDDINFIAEDQ